MLIRQKQFSTELVVPRYNLTQVNGESVHGRYYVLEDQPDKYFSVSTILSATLKSDKLDLWKKTVGEKKADEIVKKASERGIAIHTICENYLNNQDISRFYFDQHFDKFKSIKVILDKYVNQILAVEQQLYHDQLKIAGTVDCIAYYDGVLSILDFKSARTKKPQSTIEEKLAKYKLQATAYAMMFERLTNHKVEQLVLIFAYDSIGAEGDSFKFAITDELRDHVTKLVNQFYKQIALCE